MFAADRRAFTAAHWLARQELSRADGRPPASWRFAKGPHGKPDATDAGGLRFNLSHTRFLVAVAVSRDGDLGIDVERIDPTRLGPEVARRYFAPAEQAYLATVPAPHWSEAAYAFWTLKEAYIKAIGLGLACPLDAFAFTLDPLSIAFDARLADDPASWRLERRRLGDHWLALAVRHDRPHALTLDLGPADAAVARSA